MTNIKAVVYDFGGVLLSYEGVEPKWNEMSRSLGLPDNAVHSECVSIEFSEWLGPNKSLFLGTLTVDDLEEGLFIKYLREKYGDKIPAETSNIKPYSACLRGNNVRLHHEMVKTVEKLHNAGFKTAMLTNNFYMDREHKERRLPIDLTHFDEVVESCLEHLMKPDPKFYKLVEERLSVKPEEILFLDDLPENIEAANNLGWKTIHVKNIPEAVEKLSNITGIQFS